MKARSPSNFIAMISFFLLNYRRSRAFIFLEIFFIVISAMMSLISILFLKQLINDFVPNGLKISHYPINLVKSIYNFSWGNIAIYLPILASSFFAANAISSDIEEKNIYTMLSFPMSKEGYLFSKLFSSFASAMALILTYCIFQFVTFLVIFKTFPGYSFIEYILLLTMSVFTDCTVAMLFSTLFVKNNSSPLAFLTIFLIISNLISLVSTSSSIVLPSLIITNAQREIFLIFLNVSPYFLVYSGALSPLPLQNQLQLVYIQFIYLSIFLLLLYLSFARRGAVK